MSAPLRVSPDAPPLVNGTAGYRTREPHRGSLEVISPLTNWISSRAIVDRHTAGKAWIAGSAVVLLLGATSLAGAQPRQPVADVAVGSQILWPVDPEDPGVVPGWFVSVDEHRTDQIAIAYEFEHYFRDRSDTHGDTHHWYIGLAGIRYAWPGRRVTPFVQFLAGAGVLRVHEELPPDVPSYVPRIDVEKGFVIQPGGGVDIPLAERVALRLKADFMNLGNLRLAAGVTFGVGDRSAR